MIHNLEDTRGALLATQDSVLIRYRYDDVAETLTMVLSYLYQDAGATCAFLRLRFMDVSHFERGPGIPPKNQHIQEAYSRGDATGTYCVELVHIGKKANVGQPNSGIRIAFLLINLGRLAFVCQSMTAETRNARRFKTRQGEWELQDFYDGELIDFDDPFA